MQPSSEKRSNYLRALFAILCTWYFLRYATSDPTHTLANWNFVDNVDLIIHEAGHWIFIFFGEFLHVLGGSLTQILIPVIFSAYFFLRRQLYSGSIILFWVGENIISVATYMRDSVVMKLPLLGGDGVTHDWNYLLSTMHLLPHTVFLANLTNSIGFFVIITAAVLSITFSFKSQSQLL